MGTPWDDLIDAEERQTEANRTGDQLDRDSAEFAVNDAKIRCAAFVAEMFLHAARTDGVRQLLGELVESLEPADLIARKTIDELLITANRFQAEHWRLANAVVDLEERMARLERAHG